jgi:A/G-specific adenine glycosylase
MDNLIPWYQINKRDLPWRNTKDPYKIWLSEIILQQTKVSQGLAYYLKFTDKFPHVHALANADIDNVLLLWQGLGYYSRARNLHATAKAIEQIYNGVFPQEYKQLINLKGIGDYTASAIASIAFNKPHAVVDGNVYRVLSRYMADSTPVDSTEGVKRFKQIAQEFLCKQEPGAHNEALMELGARVCMPKNPDCEACPLKEQCLAFASKEMDRFPVKTKRIRPQSRHMYFVYVKFNDETYIQKRGGKDIWQGLYQFPVLESKTVLPKAELLNAIKNKFFKNHEMMFIEMSGVFKHVLSHQIIRGRIVHIKLSSGFKNNLYKQVPINYLLEYPMPRLLTRYIEQTGPYTEGDSTCASS